jgi:exopolysaccharide/PEP-CTERM locus tyrosine autokinase
MSIIEQAVARMRNQAAKGLNKTDTRSKPGPQVPELTPHTEPPVPGKYMTLDMAELRLRGYLPEESKDRQFAEHYRRIKRPLIDRALALASPGEPRVIMVTSALPGDGKTFTSLNLALSMALERDVSVLLVDCDVVKRHVSQIVGLKSEAGLLDALLDESVDVESLVTQSNLPGLSVLPAGTRAETTSELLSSNRMRQIVRSLCKRDPRRILLLDSPPLLITNEGRALVNMVDQIVLVVRAGHTPRHAVQEACSLFDEKKAGGIILNQVPAASGAGYYSYGAYEEYGVSGTKTDAP